MLDLIPTIAAAATVFAATNIDDIILLALFFGDARVRPAAVVGGQFLGIGALTAVSAVGGYLALAIPPGWPALLGVVPLYLGIRGLFRLRARPASGGADDEHPMLAERHAGGRLHSQVIAVAAVTIANGGDNLGVYIPLFAGDPSVIAVYAIVFAVFTAAWCLGGCLLVRQPVLAWTLQRCGRVLLPVVLMAVGLHVLSRARVLFG